MVASPDLTLWGVGTSRTVRAHWALHELGLPYKIKPIGPRTGETKTAEYTALNPRQKIPLLQDGDFSIGESAAIVAYLSRSYATPDRVLIPERQRDYAAWLEWCFFIVTELDSTSLYVMRRHRADALGHIYGVAPDVVAQAAEYFRQQLRHVEVALSDGRTYLMGENFTSADILLTTCLEWAIAYGVGICGDALPYLERIQARPAYLLGKEANAALTPMPTAQPKDTSALGSDTN
jgi:glutathione S-transferase